MVFHDIFSSSRSFKSPSTRPIIIDIHEKNSLVPAELSRIHIPFSFQSLKVGDYLINGKIIERKTLSDLESSILSKRIFSQLEALKSYPSPILLIESPQPLITKAIHENSLRGFILSILLHHKIPIIFTNSESDTAKYISLLARPSSNHQISLRPSKPSESLSDQAQFILEGFPNVGPATAKKLLIHFKSIKNIINARQQDLLPLLGKNTTRFLELVHATSNSQVG